MRVALLGPLHVSLDSQPVTNFGYDKVRALLAYLLVEGDRPLQRDALATLLWPDAPAGAARKSLRTALAILRQAIGDATAQPPVLQIDRDTIQRNPHADVVLDVTELRAHLAAVERHAHATGLICVDCADRLARAVELYRGAFLQQISMPDSVAWEEWALLIRERLHGQLLDALAQLMVYHEARGEDEQVRQYAWRALAQEAWDEAAHRCLMRVYARGGQRSAALAQYERCRKLLANELGVALAAETTALYERIRSGPLERVAGIPPARHPYPNATPVIDAPSQRPPTRASNVPIPPTPLIGRADAVAAAAMRLRQPDGRLLTLIGPPGVGKTRLGLAVAQALRDDFADGVHFVALAPIRDPALVASALAHVLGLKKVGDQPYTEILRAFLQSKSLLLLLDNFEHLLEAAPLLAHLLSSCAHLKVLVTSRAALQLRAERRCPVAPLALPDSTQQPALAAMASAPSIALFVERAQAVAPAFTLSDANASTIAAICARLDGLPLAIELAAGRLSLMTPATLLAQLTQQLSVLDNGARDLPVHQRTLRTAIGWSYELLPAQAQRLLRCIGVFAGGCTWEALAAVSDSAADGMHMLMEGVETLVYQNLVQSDTTSDDDRRFTVFEAIREYALERLAQSDEIELLQRRHAAYYLTLAETAAPELEGPTQASWLKRLEAEHNNMRAALQWALDQGEREVALRFGVALRMFWHVHCYHSEGQRLLETALAMPHQTDDLLHAEALRCAALLANAKDDFDRAQILFEKSLTICQDLDDPRSIMRARYGLAHVAEAQGNAALAYHLYEESLAWNRDAHDEPGAAWALKNLGSMHLFWFVDPVTAARYIEESLQLFRN